MQPSKYRFLYNDAIKIGDDILYKIIYHDQDNNEIEGGYITECSVVEDTYVSPSSYIIRSKIIDSYIDGAIISNSIIADSTVIESHLSYTHISESLIGVDLTLCTLYGEELLDMSPILGQ